MGSATKELLDRAGVLIRERADLTARIKVIDADVATLKRAAEILEPGSDTTAIPTISASARKPRNAKGLPLAMLEVLRDAQEPLTATEVCKRAMERTGQSTEGMDNSTLSSRAITSLKRYSDRGTLVRLDDGGSSRWAVARQA